MSTGARVGGYVLRVLAWAVPIGGVLWAANVVLDQGADWWEVALYTGISGLPFPLLVRRYRGRRHPVLVAGVVLAFAVVMASVVEVIWRDHDFFMWFLIGVTFMSMSQLLSRVVGGDEVDRSAGTPRDPAAD